MSELTIQRAAPSRALSVLALLGLAGWAVLTLVIGIATVVNGVRNVSSYLSPSTTVTDSEMLRVSASVALSLSLFVLWILYLNVVLVAVVLGVVGIATVQRSWRRAVAFVVVAVAGPVGALVVSQVGNGDDEVFPTTSYLEAAAPGVALIVIALGTVAAAWWLLDLPLSVRRTTPRPAS